MNFKCLKIAVCSSAIDSCFLRLALESRGSSKWADESRKLTGMES